MLHQVYVALAVVYISGIVVLAINEIMRLKSLSWADLWAEITSVDDDPESKW